MLMPNLTADEVFADILDWTLQTGVTVNTRNSVTKRTTGWNFKFNSTPLINVRRTAWKTALREWEWFMSGSSNIKDLHPSVHSWWAPWADSNGEIKYNYSKQFRNSEGSDGRTVDQVEYLINSLKNHPFSRRAVIGTWNPADMTSPDCPITNCHTTMLQAFVDPESDAIDFTTFQRSADLVLGLPHNWIQSWAFLLWVAHRAGRQVGMLTWVGGDCHIYQDHEAMARRIAEYEFPENYENQVPKLIYTPTSDDFKADDFKLDRPYEPIIKESLRMTV